MVEAFPEVLTEEQLDAVLAGTDDAEVRAALRERLLAEKAAERAAALPAGATALEAACEQLYGVRLWLGAGGG